MFKRGFATYKIKNLTVNIFTHEVVFIYVGKKGTYIKNIQKRRIGLYTRIFAMCIFIGITFFLIFTAVPSGEASTDKLAGDNLSQAIAAAENEADENIKIYSSNDVNNILEDEKLKNDLLLSSKTDYSAPVNETPLKIITHKVKPNESLGSIARKYGVSIDTICGSNKLRSYDYVEPGATLRIPNKDGILYNMKEGTNIVNLASKYKIPVEKILAVNNIKNPDFVSVGELIFIPDAKPFNLFDGFLWPVSSRKINCGFGWRRNPFNSEYMEFHRGIDIAARYEAVKATKYGQVTYAGWMSGYGNAIIIAHPGGWKSLYGHLSRIMVSEGQYVKQGQIIAKSGNTGRSTGPHLHFELISGGNHTNPRKYLK